MQINIYLQWYNSDLIKWLLSLKHGPTFTMSCFCASKTLRLKDFYSWFLLLLHIINAIHFECNVPDIFMFDNGNLLGKCHQE